MLKHIIKKYNLKDKHLIANIKTLKQYKIYMYIIVIAIGISISCDYLVTHKLINQSMKKTQTTTYKTINEKNTLTNLQIEYETQQTTEIIEPNNTTSEPSTEPSNESTTDFTVEDLNKTMYAIDIVNIRDYPSTDGNIFKALHYSEEIIVTGICDNGWTRVDFNGQTAYVQSDYLSDTKPDININLSESNENSKKKTFNTDITQSYSGFIQRTNNEIDSNFLQTVDTYYHMIPQNVQNSFESHGWQIIVSNERLKTKFTFDLNVMAVTEYTTKTIWIDYYNSDKDRTEKSIIHEIGHFIDWYTKTSSGINDIRNSEINAFCSIDNTHQHNTNTTEEYFAEAYLMCILNPNEMQLYCPKTYEYDMNASNQL